ncbi:SDR family NAD(P)-dependent oxidoreductase [Cohnella abietis]|uniref:Beta-ketoacyl-ACP reductase n=1 Tax=Cohnella abietis TaxID=2507935 RepID=A0A3T1DBV8_9BACL|nr:SDR family oxidoreductase [Cohnella abietis]BBI35616.1 beta-ketoacyl-ACP reductase [Cohnella abietis]
MNPIHKVCLVTGASRGIGRGIALMMAEAGYRLAITHLAEAEEAAATAELIRSRYGGECLVLQANLIDPLQVGQIVADTTAHYGRLDVMVNNAGVTVFGKLVDLSLEELDQLLHLNLRAPLLGMKAAAQAMIACGAGGNIVNIASSRGQRAYSTDAAYGASKAGLIRATESVALELAPYKIRVNCIAIGVTRVTDDDQFYRGFEDIVPLGRPAEIEEVGRIVKWLVSQDADYITGTTLRVDGGLILPGTPEPRGSSRKAGYEYSINAPRS